ncbi:acylphosphatase [Candidatus Kapabacteria bacterium]|nr:acylphosphatase [Candidatus Kapabacteria bacterium]
MKSYQYLIKGKVQGVFFRATTKDIAINLGINGIIKNLPTGEVYLEAEANEQKFIKFEEYLRNGPKDSIVESVDKKPIDFKNYTSFEILS